MYLSKLTSKRTLHHQVNTSTAHQSFPLFLHSSDAFQKEYTTLFVSLFSPREPLLETETTQIQLLLLLCQHYGWLFWHNKTPIMHGEIIAVVVKMLSWKEVCWNIMFSENVLQNKHYDCNRSSLKKLLKFVCVGIFFL